MKTKTQNNQVKVQESKEQMLNRILDNKVNAKSHATVCLVCYSKD